MAAVRTVLYEAVTTSDPAIPGQAIVTYRPIHLVSVATPVITLPIGATPSVLDYNRFRTSGPTPLTNFLNGVEGQSIQIIFDHVIIIAAPPTSEFKFAGGGGFTSQVGDTMIFTTWDGGLTWDEMARKIV